ncbi:hypothetical protein JVT61DRAFT_9896 [Boletus reticuloceps]|uniref:Uncharacterized protein n=1 Tax=Boletus reticuloceps TaxID=495285 RepID=A0A8I3A5J3_9AGAM|nr:hypothetical protein JVT61DRAFT_9896 [Boletus reticuloceps]
MADERTALTMTWLNSAIRSSQKCLTLINQVQIRQWALMDLTQKPAQQKPTLQFRELSKMQLSEGSENGFTATTKSPESETDLAGAGNLDAGTQWLDSDNSALEGDTDYICSERDSLAAEQEANLDIPYLLDLLSNKPVESP